MAEHLLILNAAEGQVQLVLARLGANEEEGHTLLAAQSWHAPSQGAELLAPALRGILDRLHLVPGNITQIAAVRGPGSFTGLRLALATAAGLARPTGARQAGIAYLPLLALNAARHLDAVFPWCALPQTSGPRPQAARLLVLTHARKQLVHLQEFSAVADKADAEAFLSSPEPETELLVCSPEEAAQRCLCEDDAQPVFVLGSGLTRNRSAFVSALSARKQQQVCLLPAVFDHPAHDTLLEFASACEFTRDDISPLYARHADAEENLERIAISLRLDPAAARARFEQLTDNA